MCTIWTFSALLILAQLKECAKSAKINCALNILVLQYDLINVDIHVHVHWLHCRYPDKEQLQTIYGAYLTPIINRQLSRHPVWGNASKIFALAGSMVQLYDQVSLRFFCKYNLVFDSRTFMFVFISLSKNFKMARYPNLELQPTILQGQMHVLRQHMGQRLF